ncbi:hypothetical protein C7U92_29575 [Bradyrhizobium sp. WBOS7]|uniref:Uncharacterized protein n=1 Tax=Bradyrhizobium betae TaxID=244734 RepID=A0AAE9N5V5_9BRAD|nr:hypothetical protein [Bradyrhizobium sp. WBOS2]MDD1572309.1 hypothetical protein [Bradyrhizobium sp. WBOS1]MDD1580839.1 hypothetical protein [Bradyrhizobium sp. WBOS7]MDD1602580.1 hypothetical protein [Bradyrhizobium sp. WBOS16]UUO34285.1 hypothetical protein DCK84_06660 [Bradyrhizobium sp. WBOS01]UUO40716.1 hypothetical protein DCM75_08085 [Bradyrhizobium sp. WBOS02]UUO52814.1 hypothetical protein DCM79_07355 [Bradyrhizobium sp. WBOS07]UUO64986.1 hypothetical protein DCM83_06980 [Bradyrh
MRSIEPGISRFRARSCGSSRNDDAVFMTALSHRDSGQISAKVTSVRSGQRAARGGTQWKIKVANPTI